MRPPAQERPLRFSPQIKKEGINLACYVFCAGSHYGLAARPEPGDTVIAADGGWKICEKENIVPTLLIGDFDSLEQIPDFPSTIRLPVEKDDTDTMFALKEGLLRGETLFHIYGGLGGSRTDHTVANLQALVYLAEHGARGILYGNDETFTAIRNGSISFPPYESGILSVFCAGRDAEGVSIKGAHYPLNDAVLTAGFPLGVSNHFQGRPVEISVKTGSLIIYTGQLKK